MKWIDSPKCPICGYEPSVNTDDNLKKGCVAHHITCKAKHELWVKEFDKKEKTPHLDYLRKHSEIKIIKKYTIIK